MDEDKGQLDDQPPAHPPPKPPSSDVRLLSFQPLAASAEVDTTFASADLPPTGFVRKLSTPHEQQNSWRRNPVKRGRKKTLDESISHKIKLEAEATAVAAAAGGSSSTVDNPKTFKSAVGRHSLVIKRTPGATATSPSILADKEKPILAASASPASKKKPPKDKHRRSKSEIKLPSKKEPKKASETLIYLADP